MRSNWEKNFKNLQIVDKSFIQFSIQYNPQKSIKIEKGDLNKTYFENRGKEKDLHLAFLVNNTKKACKIVGMEGIGKKAFINELKTNYGLVPSDALFIEYSFYSPNDTFEDLINYFATELKLSNQNISALTELNEIVKRIITELDKFKNVRVIFNNVHLIYDSRNRKFINNGINIFFNKLIRHNPNSNKKIYFISNVDIKIGYIEDCDLIETISLLPMKAYHIKLIISKYFGDKQNHELAQKVFDLQDDLLNSLIGGHPQIAKLFVKACENMPFDLIINDENFRLKFEISYKVQYLIEKITIEQNEYIILNHMAFLKENVGATIDFFKFLDSNSLQIIETLKSKFLIESQIKDDKEIYYLPSLIKNFIHGRLKLDNAEFNYQEYAQNIHHKIGDYFWNFAEKFETDLLYAEEYYRLALYHFVESKNLEKLRLFILRFKPTIFEIAKRYFYSKKFQQAYDILEEVYKVDKLMPSKLLVIYLECEFNIVKKSVSKTETRKKYENALREYEGDESISASFARFLFNIQLINESKEKCEELLESYPFNFKVRYTYPKVLYKLGDKMGAIRETENWIVILERKYKANNLIALDLAKNYLSLSSFIESDLKDINHLSVEVIKNIEITDYPQALKILDETTYIFDEIINIAIEKLLILPDCNIQVYDLVVDYVKQKQKPFLVERLASLFSRKSNFGNELNSEEVDISNDINEQTVEFSKFTRRIKTSIEHMRNNTDFENIVFTRTNILDKVSEQKKIAEQSLTKINRALDITPTNFQALSSKIENLINTEYLYLLEKILNNFYDKSIKVKNELAITTNKIVTNSNSMNKIPDFFVSGIQDQISEQYKEIIRYRFLKNNEKDTYKRNDYQEEIELRETNISEIETHFLRKIQASEPTLKQSEIIFQINELKKHIYRRFDDLERSNAKLLLNTEQLLSSIDEYELNIDFKEKQKAEQLLQEIETLINKTSSPTKEEALSRMNSEISTGAKLKVTIPLIPGLLTYENDLISFTGKEPIKHWKDLWKVFFNNKSKSNID